MRGEAAGLGNFFGIRLAWRYGGGKHRRMDKQERANSVPNRILHAHLYFELPDDFAGSRADALRLLADYDEATEESQHVPPSSGDLWEDFKRRRPGARLRGVLNTQAFSWDGWHVQPREGTAKAAAASATGLEAKVRERKRMTCEIAVGFHEALLASTPFSIHHPEESETFCAKAATSHACALIAELEGEGLLEDLEGDEEAQ